MSDDNHSDDSNIPNEEEESDWYFSRRGMLAGAGVAGGLAVGGAIGYDLAALGVEQPEAGAQAPQLDEAQLEPTPTVEEAGADAFEFFDLEQAQTVEALAERIYPATDRGPGATKAGVAFFIDERLKGPWGRAETWYLEGPFRPDEADPTQGWQYDLTPQDAYEQGLGFLDEYVSQEYGSSFVELGVERQKAVISALQEGDVATFQTLTSEDFFTLLYTNVLEGMFSDPIYGGNRNMIGWRLKQFPGTPGSLGSYRARIDEDQFIEIPPTALEGQDLGPEARGGPEPVGADTTETSEETDRTGQTNQTGRTDQTGTPDRTDDTNQTTGTDQTQGTDRTTGGE